MITTIEPLVNAMTSQGYACSSQTKTVLPKQADAPLDFCLCSGVCEYTELALFEAGGEARKNDFASFLIDMIDGSGSFEFFLDDGSTRTPLIDNTYGTYFGFGDLGQANKVGFIIDWAKVGASLGAGYYTFIAEITEFGQLLSRESHTYWASQFSDVLADGTVRLKTINSNCTQNGIDYTGMLWPRSLRIAGDLVPVAPDLELTESLDSLRRPVQIQAATRDKWQLRTNLIPGSIYEMLKNDIKSSNLTLDDYALYAFQKIEAKAVSLVGIDELEADFKTSDKGRTVVELQDIALQLTRNL